MLAFVDITLTIQYPSLNLSGSYAVSLLSHNGRVNPAYEAYEQGQAEALLAARKAAGVALAARAMVLAEWNGPADNAPRSLSLSLLMLTRVDLLGSDCLIQEAARMGDGAVMVLRSGSNRGSDCTLGAAFSATAVAAFDEANVKGEDASVLIHRAAPFLADDVLLHPLPCADAGTSPHDQKGKAAEGREDGGPASLTSAARLLESDATMASRPLYPIKLRDLSFLKS